MADEDFIPVNTPLLDGNEKKYLTECIDTGWVSSEGPFIKQFEEGFAAKMGRKYGVAMSNGSVALDAAAIALDLKPGDEVIMPTFTIICCASAITRTGALPVLVDADPLTWNMDVSQIEARITPKTKAIMVVHIYGLPVEMDKVLELARKHDLKIISVADLVRYRIHKETLVRKVVEADLPTDYGTFRALIYENVINGETHVALTMGDFSQTTEAVLVRVQTENITFAMFGSKLGEASTAISSSLKKIAEAGKGVILYLRQREHNLDLIHQLQTYALMQDKNLDFQTARRETGYGSFRDYGIGAQILNDLGVRKIRLLSNHPPRITAIEGFDLEIAETVGL